MEMKILKEKIFQSSDKVQVKLLGYGNSRLRGVSSGLSFKEQKEHLFFTTEP